MKELVLKAAMPILISILEEMMTAANLKQYGSKMFDIVEEFVLDSDTTIDDTIVLPIIKTLRTSLGLN